MTLFARPHRRLRCLVVLCLVGSAGIAQSISSATLVPIGEGWAGNSVNAVAFRKNSLVTWGDTQFVAYYDSGGVVMLGKRKINSPDWQLSTTRLKGNVKDAHNSISLMVDGRGFVHLAWDHHNSPLRYARSAHPASLELTEFPGMTGLHESRVTYPEFYRTASGDLLFLYRDGESGRGNLVINAYDALLQQWRKVHSVLIDGEEKRNAYWQAFVDVTGTVHLSWVWRESADVASNHDLCYARSKDGGFTWEKSSGEKYVIPITEATAEYALRIPQNHELINQTSMAADEGGNPYIASYWRTPGSTIPQYHLVYSDNGRWQDLSFDFRSTPFTLSGMGTKRIPLARPQVMVKGTGATASALVVFRDEERSARASVVRLESVVNKKWRVIDLLPDSWGAWEPTYDTELWKSTGVLHLFMQHVEQADAEGVTKQAPQRTYVLQWKPFDN